MRLPLAEYACRDLVKEPLHPLSGKRARRSGMDCRAQTAAKPALSRGFATPQIARSRRGMQRNNRVGKQQKHLLLAEIPH